MTICRLTDSSKLIGLLNGQGHSVSHTTTLQHDTALAISQLKNNSVKPNGVSKDIFSTIV